MNVVVMGVDGAGKSRVGRCLAEAFGARFIRGSALLPPDLVAKSTRGEPLTDAERVRWVNRIGFKMALRGGMTVTSHPLLLRSERDCIREVAGNVLFVYLQIARAELEAALTEIKPMTPSTRKTLDCQFARLESPVAEADVVTVDAMQMTPADWDQFVLEVGDLTSVRPVRPARRKGRGRKTG